MSEIGRLIHAMPREAWPHEARDFTPWLAAHLDQLADAIRLPLELEDSEVAVESFSADILARNPTDGSLVLIENQLEPTNHLHLGQLLTYMAGLDAQVVVWVATEFREAHLSAIKWLNEHTVDPFAFFAVRLRVVRIAESPFAPIFEVLSRPNDWERRLQASHGRTSLSDLGQFRRSFWATYLERHPEDQALGVGPSATSSVWLEVEPPAALNVALWIGRKKVGLFVRGLRGSDGSDILARLEPFAERLVAQLGADFGPTGDGYLLPSHRALDMSDPANWPEAIDWLHDMAQRYIAVLKAMLSETD